MTNEVSNVAPVVIPPKSLTVADNKSVARSESGKQVPPPGESQPEAKAEKSEPSESEVLFAAQKLAEHTRNLGRELHFEVDSELGQTVLKVVDPETEEVVRQIPSEEAVERARSSEESAMNFINEFV